ncbi:MAG: rod shape-determining protein MreC [Actinomycetota bacterium]|nr:rod shape-determining protein MreC [Actinomycetota bacterium]
MFRRSGRGRFLLVAFVALSIGVITLDFQTEGEGPLDKARDVAGAVVAPIQRGVSTVVRPVRNFFSSIGDLSSLRDENEELQDKLAEYEVKAERADAIEEDLAEVREELELEEPWFNMNAVAAEVIADQPANYKWAVTISKGSADGIKEDMAVIDGSAGGLVGKTVEPITDDTATVLLLIDPQAAAKAKIEGVRDTGGVYGNGGGEDLTMDFVDPESEVDIGASVLTATYAGGIFPPNIPIGTISDVQASETSLTQSIDVEPTVDFDSIQTVQVLLETGPIDTKKAKPAR